MKILIDMNLSYRWVSVLADAGISATHWSSLGSVTVLDSEITAYARKWDWVILTQDLDFGEILAVTNGLKPSVIQIRAEDISPEASAAVVIAARQVLVEENPHRRAVRSALASSSAAMAASRVTDGKLSRNSSRLSPASR